METYLFKSIACLGILVVFYKAFLEKENMHEFKRLYLVLSIFAVLIIPLITFTSYIEITPQLNPDSSAILAPDSASVSSESFPYGPAILWTLYFLGVAVFSIKFIKNLSYLRNQIRRNIRVKKSNFTWILLTEAINPFTFFHFIFLNRTNYENREIPKEVLVHEETHAKELHSADILLIEIFQILFWFNPLVYVLKNAIKLNHEFLADKAVINHGFKTNAYQNILLAYSSSHAPNRLANSINYSSFKKRFTVMKTNTSKTALWIKGLLVLPLFAGLLFSFSTKETLIKEMQQQRTPVQITTTDNIEILVQSENEIFLNGELTTLKGFSAKLKTINSELSKEERSKTVRATILTVGQIEMGILTDLKDALTEYGIADIQVKISNKEGEEMRQQAEIGRERATEARDKISSQVEVTKKMLKEYNDLAKYYANLDPDNMTIQFQDIKRMHYIYDNMSPEQLKTAEKFPNIAIPPPPPPAPSGNVIPPPAPPAPNSNIQIPQPAAPPVPPIPVEHMKKLAQENASFFLNGKEISSQKAIEMVKNNKKIQISVITPESGVSVVQLFTKK